MIAEMSERSQRFSIKSHSETQFSDQPSMSGGGGVGGIL